MDVDCCNWCTFRRKLKVYFCPFYNDNNYLTCSNWRNSLENDTSWLSLPKQTFCKCFITRSAHIGTFYTLSLFFVLCLCIKCGFRNYLFTFLKSFILLFRFSCCSGLIFTLCLQNKKCFLVFKTEHLVVLYLLLLSVVLVA